MYLVISRKMNFLKFTADSTSVAPIQKIYTLQLSYISTNTPDSNRVHTLWNGGTGYPQCLVNYSVISIQDNKDHKDTG